MFVWALPASLRIFECHPSALLLVQGPSREYIHVPHAEWVIPFYSVVLEALQELIPTVKCCMELHPSTPSSHPHKCQKKKIRQNGTFALLLDEMGLDEIGLDEMG